MNQNKLLEKYILDPLSVIIKLAILAKKPIGSKITIESNIIFIQEIGMFQGFVRFVYKINKDQIQYLYNPIEFASCKFLSESYVKQYPKLINLFKNAIKGIDKLIETYKQNIIFTHSLFMYESLIYNNLSSNSLKDSTDPDYNPYLYKSDSISDEYTKEIIDNFNLVWTDERIKLVLNMIDFIDQDVGYEQSVKCLEDLMNIIDKEIQIKVNIYNETSLKLGLGKEYINPNKLVTNILVTNVETTPLVTNVETTPLATNVETTPLATIETTPLATTVETTPLATIETTPLATIETTPLATNVETTEIPTNTETTAIPTNIETTNIETTNIETTNIETTAIPTNIETTVIPTNTETTAITSNTETTLITTNTVKHEIHKLDLRKYNKNKVVDTNKIKINDFINQEQTKEKINEQPKYNKFGTTNLLNNHFGVVRTQPSNTVDANNILKSYKF